MYLTNLPSRLSKGRPSQTKYSSTPQLLLNVTHFRHCDSKSVCVLVCGGGQSRGVSERWENLSELGHLSQMYPCTFTDPPRGTDSGSRWGLVNSMWGTVSYVLSAKGVCVRVSLSLFLYFVRHFTPQWGSKFTMASTWCTQCDRAIWE